MLVLGGCPILKRTQPGLHNSNFDSRSRNFQILQKASMNMLVLVKYFLVSVFVIFEA